MRLDMNYQKIWGYSLIPINILAIMIIALSYNKMLPSFWDSLYVFYIAVIINTIFFTLIMLL